MSMLMRRFSLFELATVMFVIAIVVYAVYSRAMRYVEVAEKAAMTLTVFEVERGMRVRLALAGMKGAPVSAERVEDANPFEFAQAIPPNYLGELGGPTDLQALKPGNWFYDKDRREIAYLPRLVSRFRSQAGEVTPVIRFRVDKGSSRSLLPHLVSVLAYQWEPEYGTF